MAENSISVNKMRRMLTFILLAAAIVGLNNTANAQTATAAPTPTLVNSDLARARVEAMLSTGHADASWFSAPLLAQVSVTQLEAILARFRGSLGDYETVEGSQGDYIAHFVNGSDEILVQLDSDNKIDGMTFRLAKLAKRVGVSTMHRLFFLKGAWVCTLRGGNSNGLVQDATYSFSPDGLWMTERSEDSSARKNDWATQMWGYDVSASRLVAYQFTANGVYTKSVDGWVGGVFRSERDENGAIVSLKPVSARSMQWFVESADRSSIVREDCVRR